jgi:16S rRNA (cytosine1402-N4)-methyltransferase
MTEPRHTPVLLERVVALIAPALEEPGSILVDATLGLGGHSEAVLTRCPEAHVVGVDRDVHALEKAGERLAPFAGRTTLVHAVYDEIPEVLSDLGIASVQGVLFDLGVSSMQLDVRERGFAYAEDAPLDMRMDDTAGITAAEVLNTYPAAELARILRSYGEERFARQIARAIVRERERVPFDRSARLVELLRDVIPAPARRTGGHPAKRTFQALRIEVNDELGSLERALPAALQMLRPGGRLAVISFHSLEDRIVKRFLRSEEHGCTCPPEFPVCACGATPTLRATPRRAVRPSAAEIARNPRSQSARLRAAVKLG